MRDTIKQIFSLNTILISYICAIGYGIGYAIPEYLGYSPIICMIPCFIVGTIFYMLGMKVLNSNFFNNSKRRKITFTIIFYSIYFILSLFSVNFLKHDIDNDFLINLAFIIGFQILSFIVQYIKGVIDLKRNKTKL